MSDYSYIHRIFLDIHSFIFEYVTFLQTINDTTTNLITIKLAGETFCLPATWNHFSQRANELQHCLERQLRILINQRRRDIEKGIDNTNETTFFETQSSTNIQRHLDDLEKHPSNQTIRYIRAIVEALDLYNEVQAKTYVSDMAFRLFPLVKHIQKQLCCISKAIQKILNDNTSIIGQSMRRMQKKLDAYENDMQKKLAKFVARDIRPPVLVIPCPANRCKEKMTFPA